MLQGRVQLSLLTPAARSDSPDSLESSVQEACQRAALSSLSQDKETALAKGKVESILSPGGGEGGASNLVFRANVGRLSKEEGERSQRCDTSPGLLDATKAMC